MVIDLLEIKTYNDRSETITHLAINQNSVGFVVTLG